MFLESFPNFSKKKKKDEKTSPVTLCPYLRAPISPVLFIPVFPGITAQDVFLSSHRRL